MIRRSRNAEQVLRSNLGVSVLGPGLGGIVRSTNPEPVDNLARMLVGLRAAVGTSSSRQEVREAAIQWIAHALEVPREDAAARLRSLVECGVLSPVVLP